VTFAQQLDGTIPAMSGEIQWHLLDADLNRIGEFHPTRPDISITNDTERKLKRTARGVYIGEDESADVDEFSDRLGPVWTDQSGTEWPLGVFLYADVNRLLRFGYDVDTTTLEGTLVDQTVILDQKLLQSLSFPSGTNLSNMMTAIADLYGVTNRVVETTGLSCSEPMTWAVGRDSGLDALLDITTAAAYHDPYFDNEGTLILAAVENADGVSPDFAYKRQVERDTIVESTNVLDAANVFLAIGSGSSESPVVGRFDVPGDLPWSLANRGFAVVETVDLQGIPSPSAADETARVAFLTSFAKFRPLSFDTIPDPRHDTYDVVEFNGELYRESSWTLECDPAGSMSHELRRLHA
jgi:hypothetical protein